jgi:alanine-glyoxylate transaminase/serine-glyoxylate transaminase/serine-pyruvate transaminase
MAHSNDRHFLQIPGPANVPDRGPEVQALGKEVRSGISEVFESQQPVVIYSASGTGAWEGALINTRSSGS